MLCNPGYLELTKENRLRLQLTAVPLPLLPKCWNYRSEQVSLPCFEGRVVLNVTSFHCLATADR